MAGGSAGCSAHDPTEDTERCYPPARTPARWSAVAVPTIRPRILKASDQNWNALARLDGCSAHDPTEDTERDESTMDARVRTV